MAGSIKKPKQCDYNGPSAESLFGVHQRSASQVATKIPERFLASRKPMKPSPIRVVSIIVREDGKLSARAMQQTLRYVEGSAPRPLAPPGQQGSSLRHHYTWSVVHW